MIINVPDEFYDEFLHFLDAGIRKLEEERKSIIYRDRPYTTMGNKCLHFIKNREWEVKPYNNQPLVEIKDET